MGVLEVVFLARNNNEQNTGYLAGGPPRVGVVVLSPLALDEFVCPFSRPCVRWLIGWVVGWLVGWLIAISMWPPWLFVGGVDSRKGMRFCPTRVSEIINLHHSTFFFRHRRPRSQGGRGPPAGPPAPPGLAAARRHLPRGLSVRVGVRAFVLCRRRYYKRLGTHSPCTHMCCITATSAPSTAGRSRSGSWASRRTTSCTGRTAPSPSGSRGS